MTQRGYSRVVHPNSNFLVVCIKFEFSTESTEIQSSSRCSMNLVGQDHHQRLIWCKNAKENLLNAL